MIFNVSMTSTDDTVNIMILSILAILIQSASPSQFEITGRMADLVPSKQWRIIKGKPCSVKEHPYMVSLRLVSSMHHFCGGTILSPKSVLTAAHCVVDFEKKPSSVVAIAGLTEDSLNVQVREVGSLHIPPSFSPTTMVGDVSVLTLKDPFNFDDYVKAVEIYPWRSSDVSKSCPNGLIIGWGSTTANPPWVINETVMRCATVPVLSHSKCQKYLNLFMDKSKLCALGSGQDACIGDSGGPMICDGRQVGVISSGSGCGLKDKPGVYSRVDYHFKYIMRMMNGQRKSFEFKVTVFSVIVVTTCRIKFF